MNVSERNKHIRRVKARWGKMLENVGGDPDLLEDQDVLWDFGASLSPQEIAAIRSLATGDQWLGAKAQCSGYACRPPNREAAQWFWTMYGHNF
jgi:hypothetical protein